MRREFNQLNKVKGNLKLPGDKSISHRSVMFASMADGRSEIYNCLESEDVISTINAFKALGCRIDRSGGKIIVHGKGLKGFEPPEGPLYLGNSGTTARLLTGILTAQDFTTVLTGDKSLSSRPMKRIIDPLTQMGAVVKSNDGFLPLEVSPSDSLKSISYKLPVASAQVKSTILLTGLHMEEETIVIEEKISRDHTEKMLNLRIVEENGTRKIFSSSKNYPRPDKYLVPSDISTASFFIVLALLIPNSELIMTGVSLNPSRTGIISLLKKMGADIVFDNVETINGEARGNLIVKSSKLINVGIDPEIIPNIIDEIPVLSIAGIFAEGDFMIRNAVELRHKESDRIKSIIENLRLIGLDVTEYDDGFGISGSPNNNSVVFDSYDDHRIAMAFSVLSLILPQGGMVDNFECVNISNPRFLDQLKVIV